MARRNVAVPELGVHHQVRFRPIGGEGLIGLVLLVAVERRFLAGLNQGGVQGQGRLPLPSMRLHEVRQLTVDLGQATETNGSGRYERGIELPFALLVCVDDASMRSNPYINFSKQISILGGTSSVPGMVKWVIGAMIAQSALIIGLTVALSKLL